MFTDEEQAKIRVHYISGFGSLSALIANNIDHGTAVYKRFDKLAARDLLYYESQLLELEGLQEQYDREDALEVKRDDELASEIRTNSRQWKSFTNAAGGNQDNRWTKRMKLALEIRSTLKSYREALVLESTLLSLQHPSQQTMTALSNCFHQYSTHDQITTSTLTGPSSNLYPLLGIPQPSDHVSLSPEIYTDPLTRFLKTYCSVIFRRSPPTAQTPTISLLSPPQLSHHSHPLVDSTVSFITTLLTAILLFLPIFVLYNVSKSQPGLKLGLIALFTVLFAGTIPLVTNARRAEIFGACAAYAAVLVVFVSGDLKNSSRLPIEAAA